ncbi:Calcium-regulated heat stable protein 1 [Rhizophlyctis rosea]|uniref:Calcium-regulated heat stable protein 1 n=1 Tax=Rhizophlyctis rosea TaxID=64517 RepID=A0AAD5SFX6_9FUNG|nr:Calcium-regulated heat stable protein 1 [Rhizophlyctis rosea]
MDTPGRKVGTVKFFNSQKGYGFIIPNEGDVEVFVHHTAILNNGGFRSLMEGEVVEFDVVKGPKGMQAANVSGPHGRSVKGDPRAGRTPFRVFSPFKSPSPSLMNPSSPSSPTATQMTYPPTGYITPMSPNQMNFPQSQGMPQQVYYAPAGWPYGQYPYQQNPGGMPLSPGQSPATTGYMMTTSYPSPSDQTPPPFWAPDGTTPGTPADAQPAGAEKSNEEGRIPQQIPVGYPPYMQGGYVPVPGGGYAFVPPGGYMTPVHYPPQALVPQQQQQPPTSEAPAAASGGDAA